MLTPSQIQKILKVSEEFYGTSFDPEQIPVDLESFNKLMSLYPNSVKLKSDEEDNPLSWVVVVPTSGEVMNLFLNGKITERELFDRVVLEKTPEALYLCSAFTIPKYRNKGFATGLLIDAIKEFAPNDSTELYAWEYSKEGGRLINQLRSKLGREIKTKTS